MKNLVHDRAHPGANFANSVSKDISAHFLDFSMDRDAYDLAAHPLHNCVLSVKVKGDPTADELADLRMLGCAVDCFSCLFFAVAHILGIHFRAGEWGKRPRCGSVITCVLGPPDQRRSVYGRFDRFLTVAGDSCPGYASVTWFSEPEYPSGTPLVVSVRDNGDGLDAELGCIVRITDIDPSRVMVECTSTDVYYMMRDSGIDTVQL